MVFRSTTLCVVPFFVSLVCAQSYNVQHSTLQNMIDYTAQFGNQQKSPSQSPMDTVETGKLENDPFIRNLFAEFLVQYQQLANEQKTEAQPTITTTEKSFKPDFSNLFTSPPIPSVFNTIPTTTPTPQIRRVALRRRTKTTVAPRGSFNHGISSTTPFSTLLGRVNSLHHDSQSVDSTTPFPSLLKQRFFGVESSKPKKPSSVEQRTSPFFFQTTTTPQTVKEELPATTQTPKVISNIKIPPRLVMIPSKTLLSSSKPPVTSPKVEATIQKKDKSEFDEVEFRRQAESAKYEFASDVEDEINGNVHQREEVRDGLAVKGRYSFSDGYYKRTVYYEADDKGYRVVKEEVEPLEGPQANPDGQARVSSYVAGNTVNYQITKDDILKRNQNTLFFVPEDDVVV